ncbi:efflux RND transporter periplasmic adaptor subunit [Spirosoma arcticum]
MKKIVWVLGTLAVLGGIGVWLAHNQQSKQAQVQAAARPLPVTVAVQPVRQKTITEQTEYIGQSTFWREVPMTATTQGIVRSLNVRLNGTVRRGQPLLTVDTDVNRASLTVAEATLAKARQELARYETLHRENNATATEVETARLEVSNAGLQITSLRKQISEAVIHAPIGGTITEKPIERGMFIAPGTPLATITDVSSVKVIVNIPETELLNWPIGRVVRVDFEGYPSVSFRGKVHQIGLKGGEAGTFPVQIRVANNRPATPLRVGMTARVSRTDTAPAAVLTIPRTALVQGADTTSVYVLRGQQVRLRPIQTGDPSGTDLVVRRGLRAGEQVVVSGANGLRDKVMVNVDNVK